MTFLVFIGFRKVLWKISAEISLPKVAINIKILIFLFLFFVRSWSVKMSIIARTITYFFVHVKARIFGCCHEYITQSISNFLKQYIAVNSPLACCIIRYLYATTINVCTKISKFFAIEESIYLSQIIATKNSSNINFNFCTNTNQCF